MWQSVLFFLPDTASNKPAVACSACLLGHKVRYDGNDKYHATIHKLFEQSLETITVCPETAVGLGTPRPTIQLIKTDAGVHTWNLENPDINPTTALKQFGKTFFTEHPQLVAIVLKARSPSCGYQTTPLFNAAGQQQGLASGLFATEASRQGVLMVDENYFDSPVACREFSFLCYLEQERRQLEKADIKAWQQHYQQRLGLALDAQGTLSALGTAVNQRLETYATTD